MGLGTRKGIGHAVDGLEPLGDAGRTEPVEHALGVVREGNLAGLFRWLRAAASTESARPLKHGVERHSVMCNDDADK